jgi:uncharacterized protein (DUF2141 family)
MQVGTSFKIGTATFTVTSLKSTTGQTNLAYRFMNPNGYYQIWREDGQPRNSFANKTFINGSPVVLKRGGTVTTYSLSGTVFNDTDGDGIKDTGETGRSGVKVWIDKDKDGVLDTGEKTATTNTSGNYTFTGLSAGSTRVRIVTPTGGYRITTPSSEAVLSGWRVFIDKDKDGVFDSTEPSVFTDSSGNYSFKSLTAGTYRVRIVQASGYTRISPTSGYYEKALTNGQIWSNNNFRFTKP